MVSDIFNSMTCISQKCLHSLCLQPNQIQLTIPYQVSDAYEQLSMWVSKVTIHFRARLLPKKFWANFFGIFTTLIRSIRHRLIIKLITRMDGKSRDESLINPSLEVVYCSTALSNHCIIRFIRFFSRFCPGVMEWVLVIHI